MVTGYEANYYRQFDSLTQAVRKLAENTGRIATCLEAAEVRAREEDTALEDLRKILQVATSKSTTPEDIEQIGRAVQAIRAGFAEMEQALAEREES